METALSIAGAGLAILGVTLSIIWASNGNFQLQLSNLAVTIESQSRARQQEIGNVANTIQLEIKNLYERLEQEATRLKENTDKAESRLDAATSKAEVRLQEETAKAESRLAESMQVAETRRHEQLNALEAKMTLIISGVEKGIRAETSLQFGELKERLEGLKDRCMTDAERSRIQDDRVARHMAEDERRMALVGSRLDDLQGIGERLLGGHPGRATKAHG